MEEARQLSSQVIANMDRRKVKTAVQIPDAAAAAAAIASAGIVLRWRSGVSARALLGLDEGDFA